MHANWRTRKSRRVVQREVSKPRIDCIDGCRFALVFPIVIAHFARLEPAGSLLVSLLPVPACQVWHQQSDRAEAAHAGERACRRLLCHLGVRHSPSIPDLLILSRMVCSPAPRCPRTPPRSSVSERQRTRSWPTQSSSSGRGPGLQPWAVAEVSLQHSAACSMKVMAYYPLHFVISAIFAPMFIQVERPSGFVLVWRGRRETVPDTPRLTLEVVQHSVDHDGLPRLPELQHAAGADPPLCGRPSEPLHGSLIARPGSPRRRRSGTSRHGPGPRPVCCFWSL